MIIGYRLKSRNPMIQGKTNKKPFLLFLFSLFVIFVFFIMRLSGLCVLKNLPAFLHSSLGKRTGIYLVAIYYLSPSEALTAVAIASSTDPPSITESTALLRAVA